MDQFRCFFTGKGYRSISTATWREACSGVAQRFVVGATEKKGSAYSPKHLREGQQIKDRTEERFPAGENNQWNSFPS